MANKDNRARFNTKVDVAVKERFDTLQHDLEIKSQGELLELLLDSYKENQELKKQLKETENKVTMGELSYTLLGLDGDEIGIVQNAEKASKQSLNMIAKDGILHRAKYLNSTMGKKDFESMSNEQLKLTTSKGSAYYRISQAIETIKTHNNNKPEKKDKLFISPSLVFKLTNSNRKTINRYFEQFKTMINNHNNKHELTDTDNRKGKGYDVKAVLKFEQ